MKRVFVAILLTSLIILTPLIPFSWAIDVLIKGVDDGVKINQQQDYREAVMNAKLQVIEGAGVEIVSLTKVVNFKVKYDMVESRAKAVLEPGFQIMDIGYLEDGSYQVVLSGQVKTARVIEKEKREAQQAKKGTAEAKKKSAELEKKTHEIKRQICIQQDNLCYIENRIMYIKESITAWEIRMDDKLDDLLKEQCDSRKNELDKRKCVAEVQEHVRKERAEGKEDFMMDMKKIEHKRIKHESIIQRLREELADLK
jgi:hypothetical protein